jgi:hypothetical protein
MESLENRSAALCKLGLWILAVDLSVVLGVFCIGKLTDEIGLIMIGFAVLLLSILPVIGCLMLFTASIIRRESMRTTAMIALCFCGGLLLLVLWLSSNMRDGRGFCIGGGP